MYMRVDAESVSRFSVWSYFLVMSVFCNFMGHVSKLKELGLHIEGKPAHSVGKPQIVLERVQCPVLVVVEILSLFCILLLVD
jgi:hypothetical protein